MELIGNKIKLTEFTKNHLNDENYYKWLRDIEVIHTIGRLEYLLNIDFEDIENYIQELLESEKDCLFAIITANNEFIGTLKIGHINWRTGLADIGIMIGNKDYWSKGVASEAVYLACKYAFDYLSLRKLTSGCIGANIPMIKVFEKVGF